MRAMVGWFWFSVNEVKDRISICTKALSKVVEAHPRPGQSQPDLIFVVIQRLFKKWQRIAELQRIRFHIFTKQSIELIMSTAVPSFDSAAEFEL